MGRSRASSERGIIMLNDEPLFQFSDSGMVGGMPRRSKTIFLPRGVRSQSTRWLYGHASPVSELIP